MSLNKSLQVSFYMKNQSHYPQRFWIVSNQNEFIQMINLVCDIDMIVHPEIKAFPCIYELNNKKGFPELQEVSQVYYESVLSKSKDLLQDSLNEYKTIFNKTILIL